VDASDCVFCKIVAGVSDCKEIYQNDATLAFMDIHPANDGHCLVIPKAHFETLFNMPPAAFGAVASTAAKVARGCQRRASARRDQLGAGERGAGGPKRMPRSCPCLAAAGGRRSSDQLGPQQKGL
jgi:diadenosine tetraphosphate (Ap4A) HIT family hydrolase